MGINESKNSGLLVVDDDHGFLDLIQGIFQGSQFQLKCVADPPAAVEAMTEAVYKVVILDYRLPKFNGDHLISILQHINPTARFIILTGAGSDEVEEKFKGLGYYAFFEKGSLEIPKLRDTVQEAFSS